MSIWCGRLKIRWVGKHVGLGFLLTNCHLMVKTRLFRLILDRQYKSSSTTKSTFTCAKMAVLHHSTLLCYAACSRSFFWQSASLTVFESLYSASTVSPVGPPSRHVPLRQCSTTTPRQSSTKKSRFCSPHSFTTDTTWSSPSFMCRASCRRPHP